MRTPSRYPVIDGEFFFKWAYGRRLVLTGDRRNRGEDGVCHIERCTDYARSRYWVSCDTCMKSTNLDHKNILSAIDEWNERTVHEEPVVGGFLRKRQEKHQ